MSRSGMQPEALGRAEKGERRGGVVVLQTRGKQGTLTGTEGAARCRPLGSDNR